LFKSEINSFIEEYSDLDDLLEKIQFGDTTGDKEYPELSPGIIARLTKKLGVEQLKLYRNSKASFFHKAFVTLRKPGVSDGEPDQLVKEVLLSKTELHNLINPFVKFRKKYLCRLHPRTIKEIWQEFMRSIAGEFDSTATIKLLYEQQYGISLRTKHPLLALEYRQIESSSYCKDDEQLNQLETTLCNLSINLQKIYRNESNYFKKFGMDYIWVNVADLP